MKQPRILVGVDLSENSKPAARAGADLAGLLGAELEAIHVIDLSLWRNRKMIDIWRDERLREKVEERVRRWFEEAGGRSPEKVLVETGTPEMVIRSEVEETGAMMVVIAMSGRGAWNKLVFGSTALQLTNPPPTALVVVHPDGASFQKGMSLAVGTDFSSASEAALKTGADLARQFGSELHIVFSSALPSSTVILEEELPEGMERTSTVNWAEEQMEDYLKANESTLEGIRFESHVLSEPPVLGLRKFVEAKGINWMLLGHRSSARRRGSASVKGKWIQQMNCSTLLVPVVED